MLLLRNARLYAPERQGLKDILIEGSRVSLVEEDLSFCSSLPGVETVDLEGRVTVPGYIDIHEHITGGGGEDGPSSRCPEASLSSILSSGVTTAIGLLGTDGISRSLENLLLKARALNEEGMTCYMLSGSYAYPPLTLTGSVERDLMLIDLAVGVKTAASDHRSPGITGCELIKLGAEAHRGGLLSGKGGVVTVHMGEGKGMLEPLLYALGHSDLPGSTFLPTHIGRTEALTKDALRLLGLGSYVDFTAGMDDEENERAAERIEILLRNGGEEQVTVSSDAFGSLPRFNGRGECIGLDYSRPSVIHSLVRKLSEELPLEKVLRFVTVNPARLYRLRHKGRIAPGYDADIVVYEDMEISSVFAKGRLAVLSGKPVLKGRFE